MTNLIRRDPFAELNATMDRLFESGFSRPWRLIQMGDEALSMPVEVPETDDTVEVKASLPGVKPEDIDVSVQGDLLSIRAESREEEEDKQKTYMKREFHYGAVQRDLALPAPIDENRTEASFENGVLRLRLGKSAEARPKHIPINGAQRRQTIDQPATDGGGSR